MMSRVWHKCFVSLVLTTLFAGAFAKDAKSNLFEAVYDPDTLFLQTSGQFSGYTLKIMSDEGQFFALEFDGSEMPFVSVSDYKLADGQYTFELVAAPHTKQDGKRTSARTGGDSVAAERRVQAGSFRVLNGLIINPGAVERTKGTDDTGTPVTDADAGRDQVIADDLIVQGSICVGFDCVNNESFGADTLRLKENNLRIHFEDTSATGSFPSNDWRITVNDQANGGTSFVSIDDVTGNKVPFKTVAGAPSNSLLIASTGNIGMGTATPVLDIHMVSGNTPAIRLEQDGSSGFTAQTWDIASNEANFFIRDVTAGSLLPFRIQPGAGTNTLYLSNAGNVGLGTAAPAEKLDVSGNAKVSGTLNVTGAVTAGSTAGVTGNLTVGGTATISGTTSVLSVVNTNTTAGNRDMLTMTNKGQVRTKWNNSNAGNNWDLRVGDGDQFIFQSNSQNILTLNATGGNATLLGTLTQGSDVNIKENIAPIDPLAVLNEVLELPITTWNYKANCDEVRHMGPMAQDFYSHFGLNNSDTGITTIDTSGVALGAIQGMAQLIDQKNAEIEALKAQLDNQEARLKALEAALLK